MLWALTSILIFSAIIFIHELGHYIAAKIVGIKVVTFSFGLGKKLWRKQIGDTLFCVSAIPLGGYVRPLYITRSLPNNLSESKLIKFVIPQTAEELSIVAQCTVDTPGNYYTTPFWSKLFFLSNGLILNFLFAYAGYFVLLDRTGRTLDVSPTSSLGKITEGSSAARAGLIEGDTIIAVSGIPTNGWNETRALFKQSQKDDFVLRVRRRSSATTSTDLNVNINLNWISDTGVPMRSLGAAAKQEFRSLSFLETAKYSAYGMVEVTLSFIKEVIGVGSGAPTVNEAKKSSFGLVATFIEVGSYGSESLKNFCLAFIITSVGLIVLNAIPYPALDGGQICILLLEKIKGSDLPHLYKERLAYLGLASSIGLLVIALGSDIWNFVRPMFF